MVYLTCVGVFTATAAVTDLRIKRIPNKLTVPFFAAGLVYQLVFNGIGEGIGRPGLIDALVAFAAGFGLLWVLWMIGGGGGGDVKLMGALSVWIGLKATCFVFALSTIFVILGSVGAMAVGVFSNGLFRTKEAYLGPGAIADQPSPEVTVAQRSKRRIMGYAPPVALATWLVVLWKLPKFPGF
ncbi:MAG: prepilin peptidase, partial [Planctomycetaceae bacterium]|nr:prepilin peptidase [Planctomycetaceae bacterium]